MAICKLLEKALWQQRWSTKLLETRFAEGNVDLRVDLPICLIIVSYVQRHVRVFWPLATGKNSQTFYCQSDCFVWLYVISTKSETACRTKIVEAVFIASHLANHESENRIKFTIDGQTRRSSFSSNMQWINNSLSSFHWSYGKLNLAVTLGWIHWMKFFSWFIGLNLLAKKVS